MAMKIFLKKPDTEIRDALGRLFDVSSGAVEVVKTTTNTALALAVGGLDFAVEYASSSASMPLRSAIERLSSREISPDNPRLPLVCVPYMGEVGNRLCRDQGLGWFDLSGNAWIKSNGVYINIQGRPNLFKTKGRPADIFAPKSSRIARWLLMHSGAKFFQNELARATDMHEGFVSRIVARLETEALIRRDEHKKVIVPDPDALLDAWRETYRIQGLHFLRGHVSARSGQDVMHSIAQACDHAGMEWACTGLAAAWLHCGFAAFRMASFYLGEVPTASWLDAIGFVNEPRGANAWLIVPKDAGVFHGSGRVEGVRCVHPVQAYLDLKDHPERALAAAEQLRKDCMPWHS